MVQHTESSPPRNLKQWGQTVRVWENTSALCLRSSLCSCLIFFCGISWPSRCAASQSFPYAAWSFCSDRSTPLSWDRKLHSVLRRKYYNKHIVFNYTCDYKDHNKHFLLPCCGAGFLSVAVGPVLCCSHTGRCVKVAGPACTAGICTAAQFQAEWPAVGIPPPKAPPGQGRDLWQIWQAGGELRGDIKKESMRNAVFLKLLPWSGTDWCSVWKDEQLISWVRCEDIPGPTFPWNSKEKKL